MTPAGCRLHFRNSDNMQAGFKRNKKINITLSQEKREVEINGSRLQNRSRNINLQKENLIGLHENNNENPGATSPRPLVQCSSKSLETGCKPAIKMNLIT